MIGLFQKVSGRIRGLENGKKSRTTSPTVPDDGGDDVGSAAVRDTPRHFFHRSLSIIQGSAGPVASLFLTGGADGHAPPRF